VHVNGSEPSLFLRMASTRFTAANSSVI
jgi:hypothetical protein